MLEVGNLSVSYGRHRALEGVGVSIRRGEICVILGANGAGKSTLLKAIAGMVKVEPGSTVAMNGRSLAGMKPNLVVEEGIALVPEGRGIFGDLTVAENLQLGAFARRARRDEATTLAGIYQLFPRLAERKGQVARTMSGGEQQMVAIGRALMSKPDILMLDEPSLGLSPLLTQELFRALAQVAGTGVGILLVEQNAKQSLRIADRGYLIENGHVTGENSAQALMHDPAVVSAYLGGGAAARPVEQRMPLPASTRLPFDVTDMMRYVAGLAGRAGRIQQAFVLGRRRDADLPSAFVGRYDQKAAADPWAALAGDDAPPPAPPRVAVDARRVATSAAELAGAAGERLQRHIAVLRMNAPQPSAFVVVASAARVAAAEPSPLNGSHGLIGHNSGGLELDDVRPAPQLDVSGLVSRAATIHAAHVAANRQRLSAFVIPAALPEPSVEAGRGAGKAAKKKRKKRKET